MKWNIIDEGRKEERLQGKNLEKSSWSSFPLNEKSPSFSPVYLDSRLYHKIATSQKLTAWKLMIKNSGKYSSHQLSFHWSLIINFHFWLVLNIDAAQSYYNNHKSMYKICNSLFEIAKVISGKIVTNIKSTKIMYSILFNPTNNGLTLIEEYNCNFLTFYLIE